MKHALTLRRFKQIDNEQYDSHTDPCTQGRIKGGGQRGQLPRAPRCKGDPRDEMYLFQIKYSFEKFRNSEAIQEYNSILYS